MKIRNLALCILAFSLIGGATAGANEALQTWKGKKIRVAVNGSELADGGIQIDGKTYLPIRAMADTLQTLIRAESDTVHIYKPNVHLLLFTGTKNSMAPFGEVLLGTYEFSVLAQVDNVMSKVHSLKTTIADPSGQTVDTQVYKMTNENREMFWYTTSPFKINFKTTGQYKVKFYIKQSDDSEFELISEKAILAKKE